MTMLNMEMYMKGIKISNSIAQSGFIAVGVLKYFELKDFRH
jgi:hypothetical protein